MKNKIRLMVTALAMVTASVTQAAPEAVSFEQARPYAIYAPRPEYPYEARSMHITGSGVFVLGLNAQGMASGYKIVRSTGSPILDNAALASLRRWRFKPGAPMRLVVVPVAFTFAAPPQYR
jgi:periplasmic protein TonB